MERARPAFSGNLPGIEAAGGQAPVAAGLPSPGSRADVEDAGGGFAAQDRPLFETEAFRAVAGPALRPGGTALTALALGHCRLPAGSRVADVGCGRGATLALLAGLGFSAVGIDPSVELLREARAMAVAGFAHPDAPGAGQGHQELSERPVRTGPADRPDRLLQPEGLRRPCRLVRGAAEAMPLADGTFAAVLCECVLSVTRDPLAALNEIRRILVPGGLLVLSDLYLRAPSGQANAALADGWESGKPCGCPAVREPDKTGGYDRAASARSQGGVASIDKRPDSQARARPAGCAAGAVPREVVEARLAESGFAVRVFEDHSRLLAELAGRLVFAGVPAKSLSWGCSGSGRPGYFLCIAQAEEQ